MSLKSQSIRKRRNRLLRNRTNTHCSKYLKTQTTEKFVLFIGPNILKEADLKKAIATLENIVKTLENNVNIIKQRACNTTH